MLQEDELNRPRSFAVLLQHPFLADEKGADRLPLRFPSYRGLSLPAGQRYHFFLSHNQKEAGDIAHTLFETMKSLGLEVWYDMDAADLTVEGDSACQYVLLLLSGSLAILNSTWRVRADNLGMGNMKRGDGYMDAFEPVISQIPWLPVRASAHPRDATVAPHF